MTREEANAAFVGALQRGLASRGLYSGTLDDWAAPGGATQKALEKALGWSLPVASSHLAFPGIVLTKAAARVMFPDVAQRTIDTNAPLVHEALRVADLSYLDMVLMALATIRAETSGFVPISEGKSKYNTDPGAHPFNRYDNRADLGNTGKPDGDRYKGRGFVQLTGRANYREIGRKIGVDLENDPERANEPEVAAKILAAFLKTKESAIRASLAKGDLRKARRLVNGGSHGLDRFSEAYRVGSQVLA